MPNLSPENRQLMRLAILRVLDSNNTRFGLSTDAIVAHIIRYGHREHRDVVEQEIHYLFDKGLVGRVTQLVSPELRLWMIHANGRDYLAEQGG
jgi:hypothetical protein